MDTSRMTVLLSLSTYIAAYSFLLFLFTASIFSYRSILDHAAETDVGIWPLRWQLCLYLENTSDDSSAPLNSTFLTVMLI